MRLSKSKRRKLKERYSRSWITRDHKIVHLHEMTQDHLENISVYVDKRLTGIVEGKRSLKEIATWIPFINAELRVRKNSFIEFDRRIEGRKK